MCEDRGVDWLSEEEYNKLKEENMPNKKKTKTAGRKKKQFGGGFNQPLAGAHLFSLSSIHIPWASHSCLKILRPSCHNY